ncbi:helix-turn-helix domain-containing protein [Paenibacillus sp. GCM10012307]|uniref:Helix-turn-helix transcriptional regulator n=1 Tax=Paenibacillus roseus TaxID=2798579 RepID=A0A934J8Z3_9BACL|nr:AraC family transcriptional regulator [Paenibacillus roseus]MBJ6362555.1 helix-turn-helix transcriptional regulator [Paenibacillus roseus]
MRTEEIFIRLCGYSRHQEPFQQDENSLDTYIIRLQTEGVSRALINGQFTEVSPGDLLLFKPGDAYKLRIGKTGEPMQPNGDYFVMCSGPGIDKWWTLNQRETRRTIVVDERLKGIWHQLIGEKRRLSGGDPELISLLARSLLILLDRAIEEAPLAQSFPAFHALKMRNYIEENAAQPIRLSDIAGHAGLSVSRAVHLFKEHFGMSAMQYVQQLRLAHALELLDHSVMSLEQIAAETGLSSYTYFHRVFREKYGLSPGVYRKKRIGKNDGIDG